MQLISQYNKEIRFLLCAIHLFSKYACVVLLKDKKGVTIVNAFQSNLSNSKRKPNKIWVDQGSDFHNNSFKKWLKENNREMYLTYNKGKSVATERFIRTFKNNIYKHMTAVSKNVYFYVFDDIVDKYNNTYHSIIKMEPIDVNSNSYDEYNVDFNDKDLKLKIGYHVRISKYKNIFAKGYIPNWTKKVFVISKTKNTVPWTFVITDLNGEEVIGTFYEKELQKTNQK